MDNNQIKLVRSDDVIDVYREGQRAGFFAGIVCCVAVKYMLDRRRELRDVRMNRKINPSNN